MPQMFPSYFSLTFMICIIFFLMIFMNMYWQNINNNLLIVEKKISSIKKIEFKW